MLALLKEEQEKAKKYIFASRNVISGLAQNNILFFNDFYTLGLAKGIMLCFDARSQSDYNISKNLQTISILVKVLTVSSMQTILNTHPAVISEMAITVF